MDAAVVACGKCFGKIQISSSSISGRDSLENIKNLQILRNKLAHPLFKEHAFLSAKNNTDEYKKICDEMAGIIEASMNDLSKLKKEVVNHLERVFFLDKSTHYSMF